MKAVRFWLIAAVTLMFSVAPAHANTFTIDGTFGTMFGGPLNGGAFSGTFTVPILPVAAGTFFPFTDWNVVLEDASHSVLATLSSADVGADAFADGRYLPSSGDLLTFLEPDGTFLELQFTDPFNGIGPIIPASQHLGNYGSFAGIGGSALNQISDVDSGDSGVGGTPAAPEPSSVWLLASGFGVAMRRKRNLRRSL